jgi:hypothetical protein
LALLQCAYAAANAGNKPLFRKYREVAADGDLRNRKCFRKLRNVNRIAGLEHLEYSLQPLLLRKTARRVVVADAREPTPQFL